MVWVSCSTGIAGVLVGALCISDGAIDAGESKIARCKLFNMINIKLKVEILTAVTKLVSCPNCPISVGSSVSI